MRAHTRQLLVLKAKLAQVLISLDEMKLRSVQFRQRS